MEFRLSPIFMPLFFCQSFVSFAASCEIRGKIFVCCAFFRGKFRDRWTPLAPFHSCELVSIRGFPLLCSRSQAIKPELVFDRYTNDRQGFYPISNEFQGLVERTSQ